MKTTHTTLLLFAALASSHVAWAGDQADLERYVRYADACEHVAGEWDSGLSGQERKRIQRAVIKYCGGAQHQSRALKERYKNNPEMLQVIASHENDAVTSFAR